MDMSRRETCEMLLQLHPYEFKHTGVTVDILWSMCRHADIVQTYTRRSGRKVLEQRTEPVPVECYAETVSALYFYRYHVRKSHTPFGYIATTFSAEVPGADETVTRCFQINYRAEQEDIMKKVNTYLFVTRTSEEEVATPVRGANLADALIDAGDMFEDMSWDQQEEIVSAWVVNAEDYFSGNRDAWVDFADFMERPHRWLGHGETEHTAYSAYTGGGIWIAYWYEDEHIYYVLDNADEYFCKYDDRDEESMCYNLIEYDAEPGAEYEDFLTDRELLIRSKLYEVLEDLDVL